LFAGIFLSDERNQKMLTSMFMSPKRLVGHPQLSHWAQQYQALSEHWVFKKLPSLSTWMNFMLLVLAVTLVIGWVAITASRYHNADPETLMRAYRASLLATQAGGFAAIAWLVGFRLSRLKPLVDVSDYACVRALTQARESPRCLGHVKAIAKQGRPLLAVDGAYLSELHADYSELQERHAVTRGQADFGTSPELEDRVKQDARQYITMARAAAVTFSLSFGMVALFPHAQLGFGPGQAFLSSIFAAAIVRWVYAMPNRDLPVWTHQDYRYRATALLAKDGPQGDYLRSLRTQGHVLTLHDLQTVEKQGEPSYQALAALAHLTEDKAEGPKGPDSALTLKGAQ
jgi:hypothetical protein